MDIKDFLPIPQLTQCKRLLCIQPHPDDMDIGAGATIAYLAQKGIEIFYLTVTDDTSRYREANLINVQRRKFQRKEEQQAAGKILGVKDCYWLDFPDAGDWSIYEARNKIIKYLRMVKPDFVMTVDPWLPYEAHQDHIKCGMAAGEALILCNLPFIETGEKIDSTFQPLVIKGAAFSFTARPNVVIDVGKYRETKFSALAEHKSQFSTQILDVLKIYDEIRAKKIAEPYNFEYGEGFKVLYPEYMLHVFPEAVDY